MVWSIKLQDEFKEEVRALDKDLRKSIGSALVYLEMKGPQAGRPRVDTLNGSEFSNMKELRFDHGNGVQRLLFAFDPESQAVVLCAFDKRGKDQKRVYASAIELADGRYKRYLENRE